MKLGEKFQSLLQLCCISTSISPNNPSLVPASPVQNHEQISDTVDQNDPASLNVLEDQRASTSRPSEPSHALDKLAAAQRDVETSATTESPRNNHDIPTIDEAKAAQSHSRAYNNMISVCGGLTFLIKHIGPLLDGTPFKLPMAVFSVIADAIKESQDTDEDADNIMQMMMRRLVIIDNAFKETEDPLFWSRIATFDKFLVERAHSLYEIRNLPMWKKLATDRVRVELKRVAGQINDEMENICLEISLALKKDTEAILKRSLGNDVQKLLRAPAAIYSSDPVEGMLARRKCTAETRIGILRRIYDWATDASTPSIFWLSGLAGKGKSTVAYTVCDHFDKIDLPARLCASFFCSRQVPALRLFRNIIPTLAYQLAHHSRTYAKAIADASALIIHDSSKHIEELLVLPWQQSAKNEIENDGGEKLLSQLIKATEDAKAGLPGLKILVTSRPHPEIVKTSSQLSQDTVYRLEDIEDSRQDIRKFLAEVLPDLQDSSVPGHKQRLDELADLSGDLFIFAATAARLISPPYPRRSVTEQSRRLSLILRGQYMPLLGGQTPTFGLDSLYAQVIGDAIPDEEGRSSRLQILHNIVCALQPLSIPAHAELASPESGVKDEEATKLFINALHAVLDIRGGRVYIFHRSFSDFVLDEKRCRGDLVCRADVHHALLSHACFRIMQTHLHFNMCKMHSSYILDSEVVGLAQAVEVHISSTVGLEYACRYWTSHLVHVPAIGRDSQLLHDKLVDFSQETGLFWIEAMNLIAAKVECYDGVTAVMTWIETLDAPILRTNWTALLKLARSFLRAPVSLSTPHLYISSLATELAINPQVPSHWKIAFPGIPKVSCSGVRTSGGLVAVIDAGSHVLSVAFSPDGSRAISGSYDNSIRIWDTSAGKELQRLEGHESVVHSVAFSSNGLYVVSGSDDKSVRIWETSDGKEVQKLDGHGDSVSSVAFSPDGSRVVSGSDDNSVRVWDASTGKEIQRLNGHESSVCSVTFSPDGSRVASGSVDNSVRIWDTSTGKAIRQLDGHTDSVRCVAFSLDGRRIVSSSDDKSARIWDTSSGKEVQTLNGHQDSVCSVVFSPDGSRVVSGSDDQSVRIWDALTGEQVHKLNGHKSWVSSVVFSLDGLRIMSGSFDGTLRIWDSLIGEEVRRLDGHESWVYSVAFSPDGSRVVSGSADNSVRIWDTSTGNAVHKLDRHEELVYSVAFSPDGSRVISSSGDNSMRIWDTSTGEEVQRLNGHEGSVYSAMFSPDGAWAVSGSGDNSVRIWDTLTGKEVQRLDGHEGWVYSVAFSPDGLRVASGSGDSSVRIWDTLTGKEVKKLDGHEGWVYSVTFSPDGSRVASGSFDNSVRIWDTLTGKEAQKLDGHERWVYSVAFSPDGSRIATGLFDNSVRIWDISTGKVVRKFEGHSDGMPVLSVAFSPDGSRIVSSSGDYSVCIWDTSFEQEQGPQWILDRDSGWIVAKEFHQNRLVWLPGHFHASLCPNYCNLTISRIGRTCVDFRGTCMGSSWADCYRKLQ